MMCRCTWGVLLLRKGATGTACNMHSIETQTLKGQGCRILLARTANRLRENMATAGQCGRQDVFFPRR